MVGFGCLSSVILCHSVLETADKFSVLRLGTGVHNFQETPIYRKSEPFSISASIFLQRCMQLVEPNEAALLVMADPDGSVEGVEYSVA